jgi:hypothetical protein
MGFKPRSTVYTLDFAGTEYDGLEVRMRATALGTLFVAPELLGIKERMDAAGVNAMPAPDDLDRMMDQYRDLADHLVSWNIDAADGTELPADLDGLKTLEVPLVNEIAQAWRMAMAQVAPPLSDGSNSGPLPDLSSVPMASIPASLMSLSSQS